MASRRQPFFYHPDEKINSIKIDQKVKKEGKKSQFLIMHYNYMSWVFFNAPLEFNDIFLSFETFLCPYNYCLIFGLIEFPKPKSTKLVPIVPI